MAERTPAHEPPQAAVAALADSVAASLLDDIASAACVDEHCAALCALSEHCVKCAGPEDEAATKYLAQALLRHGAVPQLVALTKFETCADEICDSGEDGVAQARSADIVLVAETALVALRELVHAAAEHTCAYFADGPTEAATVAVEQLASCGGIAHVAALLWGRSHKLAFAAMQCALVLLESVEYSPALDALTSSACLESALYLAAGSGPLRFDEPHVGESVILPLAFLGYAMHASPDACLRLASVPAALPLLLRLLEPCESVKLTESTIQAPLASDDKDLPFAPTLRCFALSVLVALLGVHAVSGAYLPPMFVQPLVLSLLHMTLTDACGDGGLASCCIQYLRGCVQGDDLNLAELVPVAMLRALCDLAESADSDTALKVAVALSACHDNNAALLLALLSPSSRHLLGEGLPDAMTAAEVEAVEYAQLNTARRAFRVNNAQAAQKGRSIGNAAAEPLRAAARAATTARARLALSHAAAYVQLCAMAPHVSQDTLFRFRKTFMAPSGFTLASLRGQEVQDIAGQHAYAAVFSRGLDALTLGDARDLHFIVDEPGLDPEKAITMAFRMVHRASFVALLRVARRHGMDDIGVGMDDLPLLPVFDAHRAFVPSSAELESMSEALGAFHEVLTRFTWRFEPDAGDLDYECSLAATLAAAPPEAAAQLRRILGFGTDAADSGSAQLSLPHPRSECPTCINQRALGRLCALPTCDQKLYRDGTALKLCSRCNRSGYCSKEVHAPLPRCAVTTSDLCILPTPRAAPSRGLEAPQEGVQPQEEGIAHYKAAHKTRKRKQRLLQTDDAQISSSPTHS